MMITGFNQNDDIKYFYYMIPYEIKVRSPFQNLFPVDPDMLAKITESMREHGYDFSKSLNVWRAESVVVDGHTRLKAAIAAGINNLPVCLHDFESEDEALAYAIANQRDRRNMSGGDILRCIEMVDRRRQRGGDHKTDAGKSKASRDAFDQKSAKETADIVGVSPATVERVRTVIDAAEEEPDIKRAVLEGDMSISRAAGEVKARRKGKKVDPVEPIDPVTIDPADIVVTRSPFAKKDIRSGQPPAPETFPCPFDPGEAARVITTHLDANGLQVLVESLTEVTGLVLFGGMVYPVDACTNPENFVANLPDDKEWLDAVAVFIRQRLAASLVGTDGSPPKV